MNVELASSLRVSTLAFRELDISEEIFTAILDALVVGGDLSTEQACFMNYIYVSARRKRKGCFATKQGS